MSEWISLRDLPKTPPEILGVDLAINLSISPYDAPDAIRGYIAPSGKLRIEFRYIDGAEAPGKQHALNEHIVVEEGKHSGRVIAIEADAKSLNVSNVQVRIGQIHERIDSALEQLSNEGSEFAANRELVHRAFEMRRDGVMRQLAHA